MDPSSYKAKKIKKIKNKKNNKKTILKKCLKFPEMEFTGSKKLDKTFFISVGDNLTVLI